MARSTFPDSMSSRRLTAVLRTVFSVAPGASRVRRSTSAAETTHLGVGGLSMNLLTREVVRDGAPISLQPREFSLLEFFMRNPGKVLSKTMIMEHVWNYNFDPQTNVVDVLVCRLRNKIDRDFEPKMLSTLRGVGYVLKPPRQD